MARHAPRETPASEQAKARQVDRRRFLTTFAVGAGLAPVISLTSSLSARRTASACFASKRVIDASDFAYLGAMRLPGELSSFSVAVFGARKVNNRLQFFMTGENSQNAVANWGCMDYVWEFADTQSYNPNYTQAQRATVLTGWGDIYQGRRVTWVDGYQMPVPNILPGGLTYKNDRLYWTFQDFYNVSGRLDWCLGMTQLNASPQNMQAFGPWRSDIGVKHTAGWILEMPDGSMGVGMPLTGGNIGSSWGPELTAGVPFPTPSTPGGFGAPDLVIPQRYVRYAYPGNSITPDGGVVPGHTVPSLPRPGNYVWHQPLNGGVPTDVNPQLNGGIGSFTQLDVVNGCAYINLPEKHGILFAGSLATGHIWYGPYDNCGHGLNNPCGGGQGPNGTSYEPRWWIYDPDQCMRVATGHLGANLTPAAQFDPNAIHAIQLGCRKMAGSIYFDSQTRRLYVGAYQADASIPGALLPMMHVYQIS